MTAGMVVTASNFAWPGIQTESPNQPMAKRRRYLPKKRAADDLLESFNGATVPARRGLSYM